MEKFCQSCGMPLNTEVLGTDADGSVNEKYCKYCYDKGTFQQECTMEEMAEFCAPFQIEAGLAGTKEEAKEQLMQYFPTLERWKNR